MEKDVLVWIADTTISNQIVFETAPLLPNPKIIRKTEIIMKR